MNQLTCIPTPPLRCVLSHATRRASLEAGGEILAVTDHDSIESVAEAVAAGQAYGVDVILESSQHDVPGTEVTCSLLRDTADRRSGELARLRTGGSAGRGGWRKS